MKVLHVLDTTGIASILCKYLRKTYDVKVNIITRKCFDRWNISKFYNLAKLVNDKPARLGLKILKESRSYDLIHIHGWGKVIPFIKLLWKKPVILHYHGTDIRNRWREKQKFWKYADLILYSVKDIHSIHTPARAIEMPNPVDTELFQPNPNVNREEKTAVTMTCYADKTAIKLAKQLGLKLTIFDRTLPYSYMPFLLNHYEYYIDAKRASLKGEMLCPKGAHSCVGLQALACGTKVVKPDGTIIEKLPERYRPENIARLMYSFYEILGNKK